MRCVIGNVDLLSVMGEVVIHDDISKLLAEINGEGIGDYEPRLHLILGLHSNNPSIFVKSAFKSINLAIEPCHAIVCLVSVSKVV